MIKVIGEMKIRILEIRRNGKVYESYTTGPRRIISPSC